MMDRIDSSATIASLMTYADESDEEADKSLETLPKDDIDDKISDDGMDDIPSRPESIIKEEISAPPSLEHEDENSGLNFIVKDVTPTDSEAGSRKRKAAAKLVSYAYGDEGDEVGDSSDDDNEDDVTISEGSEYLRPLDAAALESSSLSRSVRNMSSDDIRLPPEPPGKCSKTLQEKIARLYEKMRRDGMNMNSSIQRRKDFRNPSIYEKLIEFCGIDEKGSNYPPELYDPHSWKKSSYYDALADVQKKEMDRREKERKDRTKVEFVTGTKKPSSSASLSSLVDSEKEKRRSKWDSNVLPALLNSNLRPVVTTTTTSHPSIISVTTSTAGMKTTVISGVGNIIKPK